MEDTIREVPGRVNILWVDDDPKGNDVEVSAFREMNFGVDIRPTNDAARNLYIQNSYNVIISDIGRVPPESATAGLDLPGVLETADPSRPLPPVVYYVHRVEAGITNLGHPVVNTPAALLEEVLRALELSK